MKFNKVNFILIVIFLVGFGLGLIIGLMNRKIEIVEKPIEIEEKQETYSTLTITDNTYTEHKGNKVIYIDAGHGFDINKYGKYGSLGYTTEGAIGEAEFAEELSILLVQALQTEGYSVRTIDDLYLNDKKGNRETFGNKGRRELFLNTDCDMMIQIHYDDSEDKTLSGSHIIYSDNSKGSKELATSIIEEFKKNQIRLNAMYDEYNYISQRDNLTIYNNSIDKPIILVECGYGAPDSKDYDYLRESETKEKIITAIIDGINNFYEYNGHLLN